MERPAPVKLRELLIACLRERQSGTLRVLNVGAGTNVVIENALAKNGFSFTCDRIDVDDCRVEYPNVQDCYQCSFESMDVVQSYSYDVAFANYVLEHVPDLSKAASQICRVLKPSGVFIATMPNTRAPEFIVARHTRSGSIGWLEVGVGGRPTTRTAIFPNSVPFWSARVWKRCTFSSGLAFGHT